MTSVSSEAVWKQTSLWESRNCPEVGPELVLDIAHAAFRPQFTTWDCHLRKQ